MSLFFLCRCASHNIDNLQELCESSGKPNHPFHEICRTAKVKIDMPAKRILRLIAHDLGSPAIKSTDVYRNRTGAGKTEMAKKGLEVDRQKFEGIVKNLLQTKPVKRENVKVKKRKNSEKLIPPGS
jgi:hypothetical protein